LRKKMNADLEREVYGVEVLDCIEEPEKTDLEKPDKKNKLKLK
jgi:hypothetical protein